MLELPKEVMAVDPVIKTMCVNRCEAFEKFRDFNENQLTERDSHENPS